MATRTYAILFDAGSLGNNVHRLDSLSGSWVDISLPSTFSGLLEDVRTGPTLPDKVLIAGSTRQSLGHYGLYLSSDAGVTWTDPAGTYQTANVKLWYQVSWADQNNIFACTEEGHVCNSSDGGATFNLVAGYPTPSGSADFTGAAKCLDFISPLIGVVGFKGSVFKTTDGGATWSYLNGGVPLTTPKPVTDLRGIHISADEQTITALGIEAIYQSTDGGTTFTMVHDFTNTEGRWLTWLNDNELWAIGDRDLRMQSTDGGATWTVLSPYNGLTGPFQNGGHMYSSTDGFYTSGANTNFTSDSMTSGTVSDTFPGLVKTIWTILDQAVCYEIERCDNRQIHRVVGQDLSAYVGQVIEVQNHTCWTVIGPTECINPVSVIILGVFETCNDCLNPPQPCYILTDCDQTASPVETKEVSTNLSAYVGMVIQIEGSSKCWTVTASEGCQCPEEIVVTYSAASCDLCPAPVRPTVVRRKVKPGNPPACDLDLLLKVNCTFADAMYKKMLSLRYGINACCEYDTEAAFVKKEVVELQMLYDPTICCPLASPSIFTCP